MDIFVQQIINGLVLGSMYALVALGYTMVYGIISLINFAHGEVLMVGAMVSWTVVTYLADSGIPGWGLLLISAVAAIIVCSLLNYTIEKIAYRPLRSAPRLAPLITAMGMSLLLQTLAMIIWKPNPKPYPQLLPNDPISLGGPVISLTQCLILGITAVVLAGLMKATGMKMTTSESVVARTARAISFVATLAAWKLSRPRSSIVRWMFSMTTIASSTTMPTAKIRPRMVKLFSV